MNRSLKFNKEKLHQKVILYLSAFQNDSKPRKTKGADVKWGRLSLSYGHILSHALQGSVPPQDVISVQVTSIVYNFLPHIMLLSVIFKPFFSLILISFTLFRAPSFRPNCFRPTCFRPNFSSNPFRPILLG